MAGKSRRSVGDAIDTVRRTLLAPEHAIQVDDEFVKACISDIDEAGVVQEVERWALKDAKGLGGRPESFPKKALLVAMLLAARLELPMLARQWHELLCFALSPKMKELLEVEDLDPGPAGYRNVRTRFHAIEALIDYSPNPKNRYFEPEEFDRRRAANAASLTPERIQELQRRQEWLTNAVIRIGHRHMPAEMWRRWKGGLAVDATPIATFARGPKKRRQPGCNTPIIERHSPDADGGWYVREGDHADTGGSGQTKALYGYEHTLGFMAPTSSDESGLYPSVLLAMARPHVPGESPGKNGYSAVRLAHEAAVAAGCRPTLLCGDNAYVNARPEDFAVPARALGLGLVIDYNKNQAGRQGEHDGALLVDGRWYCPALPGPLIEATNDFRSGAIDESTYRRRIHDRQSYALRQKAHADSDGNIRMMCPAAGKATTMRCEHKPRSQQPIHRGKRRVDLNHLLRSDPPKVCRQQSITIPALARGRFEQEFTYGTEEWRAAYQTARSTNEGGNGTAKDTAHQNMENAGRRRIRGQAANALMTCFQYAAHNIRAVISYARKARVDAAGEMRLPRTRRSKAKSDSVPIAAPELARPLDRPPNRIAPR